jgi:hypothetical protein
MLEKILLGTRMFGEAIFVRSAKMPLLRGMETTGLWQDEGATIRALEKSGVSLWSLVDLTGFIGSLGLWLGLAVCGLFTTAAIYVRRYRDES